MAELRIEYIALDKLIKWPRNPKQHDLGVIHRSMERFGFTAPILIDENTGRLVAGHGRIDALMQKMNAGDDLPDRIVKKDNMWHVPVIRGLEFKNEQEAEAYLIADNRIVELGGWDEKELCEVLTDLAKDGKELLDGIGYDGDDLDKMLGIGNRQDDDPLITEGFQILIECKTEQQQVELLQRFEKEGFKCRSLIS